MRAVILGEGTGATVCSLVLRRAGWEVCRAPFESRPRVGWLSLNAHTVDLLRSLFGSALHVPVRCRLRGRLVRMHFQRSAEFVPNAGITLRSEDLLESLRSGPQVPEVQSGPHVIASADGSPAVSSGSRVAWQLSAGLRVPVDYSIFETAPEGWMYLAPVARLQASLQCVTALPHVKSVEQMINRSREIRRAVAWLDYPTSAIPADALHRSISGAGPLRCAGGLFKWDPVCGDGTGASVRSAILAAAALKACHKSPDSGQPRAHVIRRTTQAFLSHLMACERFYKSFQLDESWSGELQAIAAAIRALRGTLPGEDWHYVLRDYQLIPAGHASPVISAPRAASSVST